MENLSKSKKWGILQVVNLGTLMSTLDVGIVNIALPTMAAQFSVSLAEIQWVTTIYLLSMVALLPFMGKLSDIWDRRKIYSFGFFIFGAGSLCIALSDGFILLLISRCIQGLGATMIMANSQAMVRQVFPDHERGRALGINAIVISLGTLTGPALGGFLLEFFNWPLLFWINVPIALVAFVLGWRWFPAVKSGGAKTSFDIPGSVLLASGVFVLMLAAENSKMEQESILYIPILVVLGMILLFVLWFYERKIPHGILDHELFRHKKILYGNLSSFWIHTAQMATLIPITFYLQGELGFPAWLTGTMLILQPLLMGVVAPFAGWFRDRYGAFFPVTIGPLCCAVSMIFVFVLPEISAIGIALQLILFGIGTGFFHATNNAEIMSAAPDAKISLAGSLLAMVRYLGQIAGLGLATLFVGSMGLEVAADVAIDWSMRILFIICFVGCLGVAFLGAISRQKSVQRSNG